MITYILCVIDAFTKYAWIKPLKYKKAKTVLDGFMETANESKRKTNKLWVDQGRECKNLKSRLQIIKIFLARVTLKLGQKKYLLLILY